MTRYERLVVTSLTMGCFLSGCSGVVETAEKGNADSVLDAASRSIATQPAMPQPGGPVMDELGKDASTEMEEVGAASLNDGGQGALEASSSPSKCKESNLLFCEDFESGTLDPAVWSIPKLGVVVGVDGVHAARGKYGLHVKLLNFDGENSGWVTTKKAFSVAGGSLFVRVLVYIEPKMLDRHFSLISAAGVASPFTYILNLVPINGNNVLRYLWYHGPGEPAAKESGKAPVGRWGCWEWEMRGSKNEMYFSLDDQSMPDFSIASSMGWTAPAQAQLRFGFENFHVEPQHPDFNVWFDEIAVSDHKIGCEL